ncbi:MAG: CHASE2 domain-containing protein, partial [Candidatus Peregrinibacteria bacterium]
MFKKILRFIGLGVLILLVIAGFWIRGLFMGLQHGLQNKFYDYDQASPKIMVVAIDEKTLGPQALGSLRDWSRENYAKAIDALEAAGVKAIGIDITFPDSGIGDDALAEALKANKNVVLASRYYFENGVSQVERPNEMLLADSPTLGLINVKQDEDGFVRKIPAFFDAGEQGVIEAFSIAIARMAGEDVQIPTSTERDGNYESNLMYVNYFSEPNGYRQISLADVLEGKRTDKRGNSVDFKDKIVLIGPTAIDLQDHYLAPTSAGIKMAGVEIHANAIQTILERDFLRDQSNAALWITILILIAANLALFSWLRVRYA